MNDDTHITVHPERPDEPDDYAKAAAVMHHTWGVPTWEMALEIYQTIDADQDKRVAAILERYGVGPWQCVELLDDGEWWENVEALAYSISTSQRVFALKATDKWWAITGRVIGDDEDTLHVVRAATRQAAVRMFWLRLMREEGFTDDELAGRDMFDDSWCVNTVVSSWTPIEEN